MSENIQELLEEVLRQFEAHEDVITQSNTQSLWDRIRELSRVPLKKWNPLDFLLVILTSKTMGILYHAKNAAQELERAESKKEKATLITAKTVSIFKFIETHVVCAKRGEDNGKEALLGEIGEIRKELESIKGDIEKLYDEVLEQTMACVENRENARSFQGISGCVGMVSLAVVLSPSIPAIQTPPLSPFNFFSSLGIFMASILIFGRCTLAINNYKRAFTHLKNARAMLVDTKLAVETFNANIDTMRYFQRMFTEDEMIQILTGLVEDFKNSREEFDKKK